MLNLQNTLQPVVKWAGGKRQLLKNIIPLVPAFNKYFEPFVGGAALLFALHPQKACINDLNIELINVYETIRDNKDELINLLKIHKNNNSKDYFYNIRNIDRNTNAYSQLTKVEKAARMIYLNKTCFNGLYRVNKAGEFNVPFGKYNNPDIVPEKIIDSISEYFNNSNIQIKNESYSNVVMSAKEGDFVYFDPPYYPLSETSSFTSYTSEGFGEAEQRELKQICDFLTKHKVKFLLSNSYCDFIKDLYKEYICEEVDAKRMLNSKPQRRGSIKEILIRNY